MMAGADDGSTTLRWRVKELEDWRRGVEGKDGSIESLERRVQALEIEQAKQGIKMGIWAALGAALPVIAAYVLQLLK